MFGILGSLIYGVAYTIGWCQDEQQEQHERKTSQEKGINFYYDKRGRKRWSSTGRKMTPQEILKEQEARQEKTQRNIDKYYGNKYLEDLKKDYGMFVILKDRYSFEEYVAVQLTYYRPYLEKYTVLKKIKDSISPERVKEIKNNREIYIRR